MTESDPDSDLDTRASPAMPGGKDEQGPIGGDAVGRFRIERLLGAGGMGLVYAAHDPELDRTVAVKLLRGTGWSSGRDRARFFREARAMAKLRHPNVVTIHDVGEHEGRPYIAMELLEGPTLSAWLKAAPRPWREVRDVFVAAGRGLAAAHDAGLVHRDFKPSNVVLAPGGVCVVDFGLALASGEASDPENAGQALDAIELTRTGAMVGTLGYMSPEQLTAQRATIRSDQWSFCVALYEALYRTLPFAGGSTEALHASMRAGLTLASGPPRFLQALLRRGLAMDPEARFPSLNALIRALDRDPGRTVRRAGLAAAAVAATTATLIAVWPTMPARCQGAAAHLAGVWDDPARARLRAAFLATAKPYAEDMWERTRHRLDAYADDWTRAHTEACEAGQVRGEQSAELLDRRMQCLDRLAIDLRTWVATVTGSLDAAGLQRVVGATGNLGVIAECADSRTLLARPPLPADPEVRRRYEVLNVRLAEEYTRAKLSGPVAAAEALAALMPEVEAFPYAPLRAQGLFVYGQVLGLSHRQTEGVTPLEGAIRAAEDAGDGQMTARAWVALLLMLDDQHRPDDVIRLTLPAEVALSRVGSPPALRGNLELAIAVAERQQGKLAEARARAEKSLALFKPGDGLHRARVYMLLGDIADDQEDGPALLDSSRRLLAELASAVGHDHVMNANGHQQLGGALIYVGDYAGAEQELREALGIYRLIFGPESREVCETFMLISVARTRAGKLPEAAAAIEEAAASLSGASKPMVCLANALEQRGSLQLKEGRVAESRASQERALAVRRQLFGDDHPTIAQSYRAIADVLLAEDRLAEAVLLLDRAVALLEKAKVTGPSLATTRIQLSRALLRSRRDADAVRAAQLAHAQLEGADETLESRAELTLAEALWSSVRERARATTFATSAQARCGGGKVDPLLCAEIDGWLARRRR